MLANVAVSIVIKLLCCDSDKMFEIQILIALDYDLY